MQKSDTVYQIQDFGLTLTFTFNALSVCLVKQLVRDVKRNKKVQPMKRKRILKIVLQNFIIACVFFFPRKLCGLPSRQMTIHVTYFSSVIYGSVEN